MINKKDNININKGIKRIFGITLGVTLLANDLGCIPVQAAVKQMDLEQIYSLAEANSVEYTNTYREFTALKNDYNSAQRANKYNDTDKMTYRWSPIMTMQLPEESKFEKDFELLYRPYELKLQLEAKRLQLSDIIYSDRLNAAVLYVEAFKNQQLIELYQEELSKSEASQKRNNIQHMFGKIDDECYTETRDDVDRLTELLSDAKNDYIDAMIKLGDITGIDISSDYTLLDYEKIYKEMLVNRDELSVLQEKAVAKDSSYFGKECELTMTKYALDINYQLLQKAYGRMADELEIYVEQAKNGEQIKEKTLKKVYDEMLEQISDEQKGEIKALSLNIPKSWLQGDAAGIRYIENDPYTLMNSILDYQNKRNQIIETKKALQTSVRDMLSTVKSAEKALSTAKSVEKKNAEKYAQAQQRYKQGFVDAENLQKIEKAYYNSRLEVIEKKAESMKKICELDRLCCGGISNIRKQNIEKLQAIKDGRNEAEATVYSGASYNLSLMAEMNSFALGVYVPEDFPINITHFELWIGNKQIGERTKVGKQLTHLLLTVSNSDKMFIRLYDGEDFVDDCEFQEKNAYGELNIRSRYKVKKDTKKNDSKQEHLQGKIRNGD